MALNALTLSETSGVLGRPFSANISGRTAGSKIEVVTGFTPDFSTVNGRVDYPGLPKDINTLVLRETLAGQAVRDTSFTIPAYSIDNPEPLPATQAIVEDAVAIVVPVTGVYVDTITPTVADGEITGFELS